MPDRNRRALSLLELPRAFVEISQLALSLPALALTPTGDGHGVFVLPGFATTDRSTTALRAFLQSRGYKTRGWDLGRNMGLQRSGGMAALLSQFDDFVAKTGGPVSLVGWSLGGVYARRLASERSTDIRQVVSLGSPIGGDPRETVVWRVYEEVNGKQVARDMVRRFIDDSKVLPPAPFTALYSKTDGVVPWQIAVEREGPLTDNIEVPGSHVGLGFNSLVYYLLAHKLAQPADGWQKFDKSDMSYQWGMRLSGLNPTPDLGDEGVTV